jgi:hypothetical protein
MLLQATRLDLEVTEAARADRRGEMVGAGVLGHSGVRGEEKDEGPTSTSR